MNDEQQQQYFAEQEEDYNYGRKSLEEIASDNIDYVMMMADNPEWCEKQGIERSKQNHPTGGLS